MYTESLIMTFDTFCAGYAVTVTVAAFAAIGERSIIVDTRAKTIIAEVFPYMLLLIIACIMQSSAIKERLGTVVERSFSLMLMN